MNYRIKESFDPLRIPPDAVAKWNGDPASLKLIGQSQNFVYRFSEVGTGAMRIVRITHWSHRTPYDGEAELEFVNYLKEKGCGVAAPIRSISGNLLEQVGREDEEFHAAVFEEITAPPVKWGPDAQNRQTLFRLGKWLGQIHLASQAFSPQRAERFHWFKDPMYHNPEQYMPESEPGVRKEFADLIHWINQRPASKDNYGLVHGDLAAANFRIDGERIIAFDFDDCCYHWFAYDIAILMVAARHLPPKYRRPYLQTVLDGYATEKDLGGDTCLEIGWFGRLSAMHRYVHLLRTFDLKNLKPRQKETIEKRRREVLEPVDWC